MPKPLWAEACAPAAPPAGWRLLATLVPRDTSVSPQGIVVLADGTWVSSQGDADDDLTLTRYRSDGRRLEELRMPGGGHGDRMRARGQAVELYVRGVWCSIPWRSGVLAAASAIASYRSTYPLLPFGARSWFQGEVLDLDGVCVRLYGVPFRGYGPSIVDGVRRPNLPARLEYYRRPSSAVVHVEKIGQLGRGPDGAPYGDRLEPEGLAVGDIDGVEHLVVGIVTGRAGHGGFTHRIYGRPWTGAPS